jgi:hypothetical protein
MKKCIFLILFILTFASLVHATNKNRIVLTDGSTLEGEIISFSEGKYTVKSPSLGILRIEESKIRTISHMDQMAAAPQKDIVPPDAAALQTEIQKLQPAITGNPDIMRTIAGLISDPDFQALFKDPEIMNAAKSLDIKTLMANEKFVNAVNNPTVKEIGRKIKDQ